MKWLLGAAFMLAGGGTMVLSGNWIMGLAAGLIVTALVWVVSL